MRSRRTEHRTRRRLEEPQYLKELFAACARSSAVGMAVMDSQTRFQIVNESLARETQLPPELHVGRTSREVVGELAKQIEPTYEKVLGGSAAVSVPLVGQVRDNQETSYWLDHCFPLRDSSGRVQQLGVFVLNVTAERASVEIFKSLAGAPVHMGNTAMVLVTELEQAISEYQIGLSLALEDLVSTRAEFGRRVDFFRKAVEDLDKRIRNMRELVYAATSQFALPTC
jgi:PAS domain-containing protein